MRTRLIVAFIVVALLAALASAWLTNAILPYFPTLQGLSPAPKSLLGLVIPTLHHPGGMLHPRRLAAVALFLAPAVLLLLAVIIGLAVAGPR